MITAADRYNAEKAPLFFPDGFPEWCALPDVPKGADVERVQRMLKIKVDGFAGPGTIAAIAAHDYSRQRAEHPDAGFVVVGPKAYGVAAPVRSFLDDFELATSRRVERTRRATLIGTHYDVTFSAANTHAILKSRNLSTHFCIDGDDHGTIWQHHNPALHYTVHGGVNAEGRTMNAQSVGIDINNPALPSNLARDTRQRGRARAVERPMVHGRRQSLLGYFPEQIDAYKELLVILSASLKIPLEWPEDAKGNPITTLIPNSHLWHGVLQHHNWSLNKIDAAPLNLKEIMS
jgi:hypothetical protein